MNRIAIQDYLSAENFYNIVLETKEDIEKNGIDYLIDDNLAFDGILFRIETLGEIAKNLSINLKEKFPQIPWNDIARTRDLIVHHYHNIDPAIIKKILEDQIPILASVIEKLKKAAFDSLSPEDQKDVVKN